MGEACQLPAEAVGRKPDLGGSGHPGQTVIGGVGSFPGAVIGGLVAGEIISITSMFNPGYAYVMLFVAMTLVLMLRPYGLLGTAGRE